jgi:heme/copper-type cytochrome/quinol oxidase subunit 3
MWLFLASLSMLFFAGMFGYLMMRFHVTRLGMDPQEGVAQPPDFAPVHLSPIFILSTAIVIFGSWTIHRAVATIRREKQTAARRWIWTTLIVAVVFCLVQFPGLYDLFKQHVPSMHAGANLALLIGCLIILHALHIIGGIAYLAVVANRAALGMYDHEHYVGIRHAALYWHFLDIVWLVMYGTMLAVG